VLRLLKKKSGITRHNVKANREPKVEDKSSRWGPEKGESEGRSRRRRIPKVIRRRKAGKELQEDTGADGSDGLEKRTTLVRKNCNEAKVWGEHGGKNRSKK